MKKIIVGMLLLLGIGIFMGSKCTKVQQLDLLMANVEALTAGEVSGVTKTSICYMSVTYEKDDSRLSSTWYCGDCQEVPYTIRNDQRVCKVKK